MKDFPERNDRINTIGMEPNRVPGITLFKYYLLDWTLYVTATSLYIPCNIFIGNVNSIIFYIIYSILIWIILTIVEDYRKFVIVKRFVSLLEQDDSLCSQYMETMLLPGDNITIIPPNMPANGEIHEHSDEIDNDSTIANNHKAQIDYDSKQKATTRKVNKHPKVKFPSDIYDNFNWINKVIIFFWPTVSELIHHQLDEFFRNEIQTGHFAHSEKKSIRFLYSIWNQFNIIAIEKFQLGHHTPAFKSIKVKAFNGQPMLNLKRINKNKSNKEPVNKLKDGPKSGKNINQQVDPMSTQKFGKMLRIDVDVEYIGDMKLSLLYRNFCCFNSRIGLKRAFLKFKFRILVGPITSNSPFIEQISFNLRELPDYGYQGIALVELAELRLARRLINNVIRENLLDPHAIIITSDDVRKKLEESKASEKAKTTTTTTTVVIVNAKKDVTQANEMTNNNNNPVIAKNTLPKGLTPKTELSCFSRFGARVAIYTCFCVNCCLKSCQKRKAPMVVSSTDLERKPNSPAAIANENHLKSIL